MQTPSGAVDFPNNSPPPFALLFLFPLLVFPFLSVEPPLSLSAGSPAVPAAASGGPRGEGTRGELTLALLLLAAAQTELQVEKKQI